MFVPQRKERKLMVLFLAGIFLSLLGSLPPGLISLSVAQTAIHRGFQAAMALALGAAFIEFFQALFAVGMTDWFLANPEAERVFQWAALPVFLGLGVYLLFFAPQPRPDRAVVVKGDLQAQFGKGALISVFNLLAIPYWFAYCGWLKTSGWCHEQGLVFYLVFSLGVSAGTLLALYGYARLGVLAVERAHSIARHANRIAGGILLFIGLRTLMLVLG
jgi:threonine/homoserine/homoserine lactone efflux protein